MDITYQYPPDLFQLLVDTIPRICRSKRDLLLFFRGAGVPRRLLADIEQRVSRDAGAIGKFEITRTVLTRLNEGGEPLLRERREILRRVEGFEDFSTCWENDRLQAIGLVAEVRRVRNIKDSFTRMAQQREEEALARRRQIEEQINEKRRRQEELEAIKKDLCSLFAMDDEPNRRGPLLESVLNRLFSANGILVRESFRRTSEISGQVLEQIDGVIEVDGHIYLVEMKWLRSSVSVEDVSRHLVRVFSRDGSRGLFLAATDYTEAAIEECRNALRNKVMVLSTLEEFVCLLETNRDLTAFIKAKAQAAIVDKNPLHLVR